MERGVKNLINIFCCLVFFICKVVADDSDEITLINSDEVEYFGNTIKCRGNVKISFSNYILDANIMEYNKVSGIIKAYENIILKGQDNSVCIADQIEVNDKFNSGYAINVKLILSDLSRVAAESAHLEDGTWILKNAVYSPCYTCVYDKNVSWTIRADEVRKKTDIFEYKDAMMDVVGVPVLCLPYFSHFSSNVDKKSGILMPIFKINSLCGIIFIPRLVYYPSEFFEFLVKPVFTTKMGNIGFCSCKYRFSNGEGKCNISATNGYSCKGINSISKKNFRGHFFGNVKYEINDTWRSLAKINLVSDKYYLKKFKFLENDVHDLLSSEACLEHFYDRDYCGLRFLFFQSLKEEDAVGDIPMILPVLEYSTSTPLLDGMFYTRLLGVNFKFREYDDMLRFSWISSWAKTTIINPIVVEFCAKVVSSFSQLNKKVYTKSKSDTKYIVPQLELLFKLPLVMYFEKSAKQCGIFTPIVGIIFAKKNKMTSNFQQFFEINEMKLLCPINIFSDRDSMDGTIGVVGMDFRTYDYGKQRINFTTGLFYNITSNFDKMFHSTDVMSKVSNNVGCFEYHFNDNISFFSRYSYGIREKCISRIEGGMQFCNDKFALECMIFNGKYFNKISNIKDIVFEKSKNNINYESMTRLSGAKMEFSNKFAKNWKLNGAAMFGDKNSKLLKSSLGLEYNNECISWEISLQRTRFSTGDITPSSGISFSVSMKNLTY